MAVCFVVQLPRFRIYAASRATPQQLTFVACTVICATRFKGFVDFGEASRQNPNQGLELDYSRLECKYKNCVVS